MAPAGGKKSGKKPRKHGDSGLLFQVRWQRVVLDEGQMIKNPRTRVAQAAWALAATHRSAPPPPSTQRPIACRRVRKSIEACTCPPS